MAVDGVEAPNNGDSSDGPDSSSRRDLQSPMPPLSYPITLKFMDLTYRIKVNKKEIPTARCNILGRSKPSDDQTVAQERTILDGITGMVSPGEILAVLGPSGSGKSTLLNALAGRLGGWGRGLTGSVLANGERLTRPVLKRIGFVAQDDVLYPHLTVRETLAFCALLRLPNSIPRAQKMEAAESVIAELGLAKCANTIIGNGFVRGVSGGERKRVSIGHEVLVDPSLLVLDEPTSGLDATAAHRVVATVGAVARRKGRTVVASVHQPSSRLYQMFESVLVLSEGRCVYFGKGSDAMRYFESVGFTPSFPVNPADFLLDLANGVCHTEGAGATEREKPNVKQALVSSYNTHLAPKVKATCAAAAAKDSTTATAVTPRRSPVSRQPCQVSLLVGLSSWFDQFSILLRRSLKERRHESFNSLRVFQVVAAAVLVSAMWWRSHPLDVQDRLGLLFFVAIFWGVLPSFNAVFAFPQDRAILAKERASGMYSLSSYFAARIAGDLPMELVLPAVFLSLSYWTTGLRPDPAAFLLTLAALLGYVMVSQGLGLAVGAVIMDAKRASTVATVTMLAFVLTGGYYVHKVPGWLEWTKYVSVTFYGYRLLVFVQYGKGEEAWRLLGCGRSSSGRMPHAAAAAGCRFLEEDVGGQIGAADCAIMLLVMFVGYRLLAYLGLRRIRV